MFGQIGSSDIGNTTIALTDNFKDSIAASRILLPSKGSENCCYHLNGTTPVASCQDITVQLDANGNGSTTADAVSTTPSAGISKPCLKSNELQLH